MIQFKSEIYKQITAFLTAATQQYNIPIYNSEFMNENAYPLERIEYRISDINSVGNNLTYEDAESDTMIKKQYPYYNFKLIIRSYGKQSNIANYNDSILLHSRSDYILDYYLPDIDLRGFLTDLPELQKNVGGEIIIQKDIIFQCTMQGEIILDVDNYSKWFNTVSDVAITIQEE